VIDGAHGATEAFGAAWLAHLRLDVPGEVFTFFSYKGGTGRSMSLVNCAGLIAQQLPTGARPFCWSTLTSRRQGCIATLNLAWIQSAGIRRPVYWSCSRI
jgi:hypothetical protein